MTRTRSAHVRLVVFVAVSVFSGIVVVNTLTDPMTRRSVTYHAVFTDVAGLQPGSDVTIAGVRVGEVSEVTAHDGLAQVSFDLAAEQRIPATGLAVIRYADLTGARALSLTPGQGGPPLEPGATIPVERTRPAFDLTALFNGFKPLFKALEPGQVNQLAAEIAAVFQGEGGTVNALLSRIVSLTATLASRDEVIGEVVDNLNAVLGTMNRRREELRALLDGLGRLASETAASRGQIAAAIDSGSAVAHSLAKLLGDVGPGLSRDVRSVQEITAMLVRNQQQIDVAVQEMPAFLDTLDRVTGYGSWANVYLCNLSVQVAGDPVDLGVGPHTEVCR
ncbi:MCE family protein [Saccharopolyspora spinosa]|uniref:Phospholipid/cholesterol/gamma-HCH transport system substrate-binding protein n=1 Tax=Saccharopolyspora spinosa TaxID=60894 RepID=A0A2N3Y3K6_SACSN|nr:MCE family protein [Saccharopolyspora spinosa]PKW17516.1 phospholipid/cholesterol/gamma-HCH transport system substrate-binding protein [Saccharopolyspora spinosa]